MKLDFQHFATVDPAELRRSRYAELVAHASNRGSIPANLLLEPDGNAQFQKRLGGLDARIAFFGSSQGKGNKQIFGAFLPDRENDVLVSVNSKNDVNLSSSMNGKPSFLGSRYPGTPGTLRGMEN